MKEKEKYANEIRNYANNRTMRANRFLVSINMKKYNKGSRRIEK